MMPNSFARCLAFLAVLVTRFALADDKPNIALDERRAFSYLEDICKLGRGRVLRMG